MTDTPKQHRGFALLSPEARRKVASMGGHSVKPENRAYSRWPLLASEAGRKGGSRRPTARQTETA